jgi:hypothetical protein
MTELQEQTKELKEKILNHRNYNDGNNKKNADTVIEIIEKYPDKDGTGILKILLEIFDSY